MEKPLLPGQDCWRETENGGEYTYRTERGEYFSCTASSLDAAQAKCEQWLLQKDRHTGI